MKKIFVGMILLLCSLTGQAQEKVMNVQKRDGTSAATRVAELKEISFLAVDAGSQGVVVRTLGGTTASVLFEANPVVTVANGKLSVSSASASAVSLEITDIAEIVFGDASEADGVRAVKGFACVVGEGGAVLRGIPEGVKPRVYALDGRSLPTPPVRGGELRLNRATLGTGVFVVKVGTFSTKVML